MKYFLIAGEASGDMLGAALMQAIQTGDKQAEFKYWGGDEMQKVAPGLLKHYSETSIMGFIEVLLKIRTIKQHFKDCKQQILDYHPDVLILVDYPGFNMRMAEFAHKQGIKTCYYVAPKIWAWNEKRGKKLEQYVDLLLLIFPFEESYFKKWKVRSKYIGNPMYEQLLAFTPDPDFRSKNTIGDKPVIALLPGSRKQEIDRMLPNMMAMANAFPAYEFLIAGAPGMKEDVYQPYLQSNVKLVFGSTRNLLAHSEAAIVCSGTASLEAAFMNIPQVVCYEASPLSYIIGRMVVKIKYASLVNLSMGREVVRELIQKDYNTTNLKDELQAILKGGAKRETVLKDYQTLFTLFQNKTASKEASEAIKLLTKV